MREKSGKIMGDYPIEEGSKTEVCCSNSRREGVNDLIHDNTTETEQTCCLLSGIQNMQSIGKVNK